MKHRLLMAGGLAALLMTGSAQAVVLINEVDSDTPTSPVNDDAEFVELYNTGGSTVDLAGGGYVLVFYNGSTDTSYFALDLTGSIPGNGRRVFGNTGVAGVSGTGDTWPTNTLQNGADAVALYSGTAATSFPSGTAVTATGLVDALVYDTTDADDSGLISVLTPGQNQIDEAINTASATQSCQRIPDGQGGALVTTGYQVSTATPNAANAALTDPVVNLNWTSPISFGTFNGPNGTPVQRDITLSNAGGGTLNVSVFELDAGSDAVFTVTGTPPTIPANLTSGQSVTLSIAYQSAASTDNVYAGSVSYTTDAPASPSGTLLLEAEIIAPAQTASVGDVLINEFVYDPGPVSPDPIQDYNGDGTLNVSQDEFLELYNDTGSIINLKGWALSTTSGTFIIPDGVTLPAGDFVVFFGGGTPTGFLPDTAYTGVPALGNSGTLMGISDGTTTIDSVAYGNQTIAGGGSGGLIDISNTDFVNAEGSSLGRTPDASATFTIYAWDGATSNDRPSPGRSNGSAAAIQNWSLY